MCQGYVAFARRANARRRDGVWAMCHQQVEEVGRKQEMRGQQGEV